MKKILLAVPCLPCVWAGQAALLPEVETLLRNRSLAEVQRMDAYEVRCVRICSQEARRRFHLSKLESGDYILITISRPRDSRRLGGGDVYALYDAATLSRIKMYRSR